MDKLLEMLGINKLDESQQKDIKEKIETIIDLKVNEDLQVKLQEEKDKLIESYEQKFEDYKEDITSKFSNFVDGVIDEEFKIPEKIVEFAKLGELYHDLIEQFKLRLSIDENLINDEAKEIMKEAKEEIQKLRKELNDSIAESLEYKTDAQKMASELYLLKKCEGLTEAQKEQVLSILEGVSDKEQIDKKFEIIVESLKEQKEDDEEDDEEDDDEKEDDEEDETNEGKGKVVDETLNEEENKGPYSEYMKQYVKTLRENKI